MHRFTVQSLIALHLAVNLTIGMAAGPAVGLVTANGSFQINSSKVVGNATLFEGNTIETGRVSSHLRFHGGAQANLAAESRGIVYKDRMILEKGQNQGTVPVEALTLRIDPAGTGSTPRVSLRNGQVQVAALHGPARVANAGGVLLANMATGSVLMFTPQGTGPTTPSTVIGCVVESDRKFWLTDETTSVKFEVSGAGVNKHAGQRVELTGSVQSGPAESNVMTVTGIRKLYGKCSSKSAIAAPGAGGAAGSGGAAGAGAGTGANMAVVAGVVVAGAAAGAAIAVVQATGDDESISPTTR